MNKTMKIQEDFNEALIEMMCLTFSKKQMKHLLEAYIKSNKLTEDVLALKEDIDKSKLKLKTKEQVDKLTEIKIDFDNIKEMINNEKDK